MQIELTYRLQQFLTSLYVPCLSSHDLTCDDRCQCDLSALNMNNGQLHMTCINAF